MRPDLIVEFRHCRQSAAPHYLSHSDVERVAAHVRSQLGHSDEDLTVDVGRLAAVRAARVNGIPYELEWCFDAPVHDDEGKPVFGVCEYDPALPECAQIHINSELVCSRETLVRSTSFHEAGHAILDAPGWIWSHQQYSSGLFADSEPMASQRVYRTITSNEAHLTSSPPPNTPEYYREIRANEFMGCICAPRTLLAQQFRRQCERLRLDHRDFGIEAAAPLMVGMATSATDATTSRLDLSFVEAKERLEVVLQQLGVDFQITRRFIEVRLKRYGLLRQEISIC